MEPAQRQDSIAEEKAIYRLIFRFLFRSREEFEEWDELREEESFARRGVSEDAIAASGIWFGPILWRNGLCVL